MGRAFNHIRARGKVLSCYKGARSTPPPMLSALFDLLLRRVLLASLPPTTREACRAHPAVRAVLRFRFAYLFAFHGPVLVPLLEALGGQEDPALSVLSLGVASVAMIAADVPTGLYADRRGPHAALRLGLRLTIVVLLAFCALTLLRAHALAQGQRGAWLPGTIGLLVLEAAIGVSLALLSGADTVLFLGVLRRSGIPGLQTTGTEGLGSSIRYLGTMTSVAFGALLYDAAAHWLPNPAWRLAAQSGLYLLTLVGQLVALRALAAVPDAAAPAPPGSPPARRPGFHEIMRGIHALSRFPGFAARMWLLCLAAAGSLFAVYLFQSPLSRLSIQLARQSHWWWPLYTVTAVCGYWACSRGSRDAHRTHDREQHAPDGKRAVLSTRLTLLTLLLLGSYPLTAALAHTLGTPGVDRVAFVLTAAGICLACNYLRGFVEPYSASTLISFTQTHNLAVPASIISGFNSLKRAMHFALSMVFYAMRHTQTQLPASAPAIDADRALARLMQFVTVGLALLSLPALLTLYARRRPRL